MYLYEFLYRGRAPGSPVAPDYHVILAEDSTDAFGASRTATSLALTPAQAAAKGFALPDILASINSGLAEENAALKANVAALTATLAGLKAARR